MSVPSQACVLFAGDLCPIHRVNEMLAAGDVAGAFGDTLDLFRGSDLAVVNLEAPLCAGGRPIAKLGPNFRANPRVAAALKQAGVDLCCLANNHTMDQGSAGLRETLRHLEREKVRHVGAGMTPKAAMRPLRLSVNGVRLSLLNAAIIEGRLDLEGAGAWKLDRLALRRAVTRERARGSLVIPIVHAGREEVLFPSPGTRDLCRDLIDAGAAAVVCHHPHVPQGLETYRGCPIAYSLGNFMFDWHEPEPHTDSSFLLELRLSKTRVSGWRLHPFRKSHTAGVMRLRGAKRSQYLSFIRRLSRPLRDEREYRRLWREQCRPQLAAYYEKRLARGADLGSLDAGLRLKAMLTFLNAMEDLEHGEVIKECVRNAALGRDREDRCARHELDRLRGELEGFGWRQCAR
jgi:poly-gamma-glutamate synthesis protein (capsule biosynthesis protein)